MTDDDRWIQTFSCKQVYPLRPTVDQICIEDIAHSLALTCRFNGHCERFYSVAQHSILVEQLVSIPNKLWALLHDAAEAYLCDMPAPIKSQVFVIHEGDMIALGDYSKYLQSVIAERFGLQMPIPKEVHDADKVALATKLRDLMKPPKVPWAWLPKPDIAVTKCLPWQEAERLYLSLALLYLRWERS